jgi:prophage regulatory protein
MRSAITKPKRPIDLSSSQPLAAVDREVRFLRFPAVRARTGLSRSTIWRLERRGEFPRHRRISRNVVAWVEAEVSAWIQAKADDTGTVSLPRTRRGDAHVAVR